MVSPWSTGSGDWRRPPSHPPRYYGQGNITEDNFIQFIKHDTLSSEYLNQSKNFVSYVRSEFEELKKKGSEYMTWQSSRDQIRGGKSRSPDTEEAYQFYLSTYRWPYHTPALQLAYHLGHLILATFKCLLKPLWVCLI